MYKDIISYKLAEGVTEEHLLKVGKRVLDEWMSRQKGFLKWEIHKNTDGSYSDIVFWASQEEANASEKDMMNIPNAGEWFGCYEEGSISSKKLSQISDY